MKYFIKTFGCQMNEADSERIAGYYKDKGWQPADSYSDADEIIINTCSVRESAENRVFGLVNNFRKLKIVNCKLKIILTGCMLRLPLRTLKEKLPNVDEFVRIEKFIHDSKFVIHDSSIHVYVPISNGCNNFCTYCVVPYSRGREVSRQFAEVICEVEELARRGYKEITLLGQNVNSYGKEFVLIKNRHSERLKGVEESSKTTIDPSASLGMRKLYQTPFAQLLFDLNNIDGIEKISFLTSNPWDLNDEIIEAMTLPKIDRFFHLPVQSGDNEILRRMNRKYTREDYLSLIDKIRTKIPDIKFGTDIIIGFPGETEKQFNNTVDLCRKVGFVKAYINKYSPRVGTAAYKLKNDVSSLEKKRRWLVLDRLINK